MKPSRRNLARMDKEMSKRMSGKPPLSKYEAKHRPQAATVADLAAHFKGDA